MQNDDWSFSYPGEGNQRKAYRINFPGLYVYLVETAEYLSVRDISAAGVAVSISSSVKELRKQEKLEINLYLDTEPILENIEAEVVRLEEKNASLQYVNLNKKQEYALDKLILDIQKMQIQRGKKNQE